MTDVVMPQMGESIVEGTLTKWLKKPGESIQRDEPLFEISTDKVDTEIPSPVAGTLSEVLVEEGKTVGINTVVARIDEGGGAAKPAAPSAAAPPPAAAAPAPPAAAPAPPTPPVEAPAAEPVDGLRSRYAYVNQNKGQSADCHDVAAVTRCVESDSPQQQASQIHRADHRYRTCRRAMLRVDFGETRRQSGPAERV